MNADQDPGRQSLLALFHEEARMQTRILSDGLLALERTPADAAQLEACMRAAHSLKGAAHIVGLSEGVEIAHLIEECFVAAQRGTLRLSAEHIDALLGSVDLLQQIGQPDRPAPVARATIETVTARLADLTGQRPAAGSRPPAPSLEADLDAEATLRAALDILGAAAQPAGEPPQAAPPALASAEPAAPAEPYAVAARPAERMLRVRADRLDRLQSLSGESLVESRRLKPFAASMQRAKRAQREAARALDTLREHFPETLAPETSAAIDAARQAVGTLQLLLATHIDELEQFDRRNSQLAQRLYDEALLCRMRPFGDATHAYPRMVRDLARSLGKRVRFSSMGESTQIDRDILDMLDAPLGHLLRNALDHGIEPPEQRLAAGKPAEAHLTLEARHSAGKLLISVSDDGAGIDLAAVRARAVKNRLVDAQTAERLSEQELLEFLLLPGFSLRTQVTDVSGRGVGLDAVHEMVKAVHGTIRIVTQAGQGTRFVLQLPLTLSVVRSLLVQVGDEAYAFPLAHVRRTLELPRDAIEMLEGQQHFVLDGQPVGLVTARQLLGTPASDDARAEICVVLIGDERHTYGIAVDRFLGERTLVVQALDRRLGKIKDIAAGALLENGNVVLIVDVEDLLQSVAKLVRKGQLDKLPVAQDRAGRPQRRILIVEDSLTVRELERKLLEKRGYAVSVAVDGMDGWNALRNGQFDLVVTDIDMPRMDGIELVSMIRGDALLKAMPVMIVSYKDRDEDRRRGLEAGADYYLAKSSFHDETLLDAVYDLIGAAQP